MAHQTTQALPDDVAQIAATNRLGPFSQAYLAARNSQPMVGGCLIVVGGMLQATLCSLWSHGLLTVWIGILLFVGGLLIGGLGYGLYGSRGDVRAAYLFKNGIIYSQRRRHTPLLWSQIASCEMRQGPNSRQLERCVVRTKDGLTIPFDNLVGYEELGTSIKNAIEPH